MDIIVNLELRFPPFTLSFLTHSMLKFGLSGVPPQCLLGYGLYKNSAHIHSVSILTLKLSVTENEDGGENYGDIKVVQSASITHPASEM